VNNQCKRFVEKHIVADDPNPEYSNLDREDGLPAKVFDFLYPDCAEAQDPMPRGTVIAYPDPSLSAS
jgi:hypothetical protein